MKEKDHSKAHNRAQREWEDIFHAIGHPAFILDPQHKVLAANNASIKISGKPSNEIIGRQCYEIFHGKDTNAPPEGCPMEKILKSHNIEAIDMEIEALGGHFIVLCNPVFDEQGNLEKIIHIATDITERTKAEKEIRQSEELFRSVFDLAPIGNCLVSLKGRFLRVNSALCRMLGYSENELLSMAFAEVTHPDDLSAGEEWVRRLLSGESSSSDLGKRYLHKEGHVVWGIVRAYILREADGSPLFFSTHVQDITERKKAEEELKESQERFRIMLDQGFDGIFIHENFIILDLNQRMADILQYSRTELLQTSIIDHIAPDSKRRVKDYIHSGRPGYFEVELRKKDGSIVQTETFGSECKFHGRSARIVAIKDITEQTKLQEQLRQSQKMEAIGHLAGGVAHDFNNILSAIVGFSHLTLMKMKEDDPLRMNLQHILDSSERAATLTQSLLAFSRKQVIELKTVNLNEIISRTKKILERVIGEDIALKVNTDDHDLVINADSNQIEQVLINLATNARDAMPHGGTLTIATEEMDMDDIFIQMNQFGQPGRYAVVSITDTGVGMDEKTKENIFEPFFTTKEVGKGTGLGLAMVYGTIRQHNGLIHVYSKPGQGTTFRLYLPLVKSAMKPEVKKEAGAPCSGNETVLLIEDDEAVRQSTGAMLEMSGYTVIDAADGRHAVSLFREHRDVIQLVISDVIMPGQSGRDVYEELKKISPGVKILFISGYPSDMLTRKGILADGVNFLSKPLRPDILLSKIREVLDTPGPH